MLSFLPIILAIAYTSWLKASIKKFQNFSRRVAVVGTIAVYSGSVYYSEKPSKMHERYME